MNGAALLSVSRSTHVNRGILTRMPLCLILGLPAIFMLRSCNAEDSPKKVQGKLPTTISATITDPEVQDRLSLSEDQHRKIAKLHDEEQAETRRLRDLPESKGHLTWSQIQEVEERFKAKVKTLLTAEQQKQWSILERLEFVTISGPAREILNADMRLELQLSDAQALAVDELQREFCRECERIALESTIETSPGTSWWESPFMKKVFEAQADYDARLDPLLEKTLNAAQQSRWQEIQWQRSAARDGPAVLLHQSVVEYLAITPDQRQEIEAAANESQRQEDEERKKGEYVAAMRLPAANLEKSLTVLNSSQKRRWTMLLGKPFRDRWARASDAAADAKNRQGTKD